jgi:hypothetical protein
MGEQHLQMLAQNTRLTEQHLQMLAQNTRLTEQIARLTGELHQAVCVEPKPAR